MILFVTTRTTTGGHHQQNCSRISPLLFVLFFLTSLITLTQTAAVRPLLRLGVSFSPAGLLTPFHLGASYQLQQLGLITPHVALAGASGGALAAVTTALEVSQQEDSSGRGSGRGSGPPRVWEVSPLEGSVYISKQCRDYGARLTLRKALDEVLAKTLPADIHPSRFGCPPTQATEREIIISPYRASLTQLDPYRSRPTGSEVEYDVITPDLLDETAWPFSLPEILRMSFTAPASSRDPSRPISDDEIVEKYEKLYRAGQEAVTVWHATKKAW
eukprot:gene8605-9483_t